MKTDMYFKILLAVCCVVVISGCATVTEDMYPRYDGMYYKEYGSFTMYFRFFEGDKVINANTDGKYDYSITEWFDQNYLENLGTYSISGNKITFFVEAEKGKGRVDWSGTIKRGKDGADKKEKMDLLMESRINGKKQKFTFKFLTGV